ncbi:hypothetical protein IGB42_00363 [Andreprevotia sp. IGB-42]|uniref:hypothetical protein n=1 Tax=Andreprevotia sp. IGB-42 TaxID=2497473 RepID=UPI00135C9670|nr:hypothetical protein [Andreprevotia sp. IGB-42]KAF0815282.1 hypothetical protein IGB42_00363 [Andreprevotia sp. IGB-42]
MEKQLVTHTAALIQRYIASRPDAADTIEGIHLWWIDWPQSPEQPAVTLAALEQLEAADLMERVQIGGRELWRAKRSR